MTLKLCQPGHRTRLTCAPSSDLGLALRRRPWQWVDTWLQTQTQAQEARDRVGTPKPLPKGHEGGPLRARVWDDCNKGGQLKKGSHKK